MNEQTDTEQTPESAQNKLDKKFSKVMRSLTAIIGGVEKFRVPNKMPSNELGGLVADLFKEEHDRIVKETREDLKKLIKSYTEIHRHVEEKRKELEKIEKTKKEEFVKAAEALFNKIDGIGDIEKHYYANVNLLVQSDKE